MDINDILLKFKGLEVLVIGDLMIDSYIRGVVTRVSPEAPVPVMDWRGEENRMGGAANVAINVAALGAKVYLCGVTGTDEAGKTFLELLEESRINASLILSSNQRPTTVKTRMLANDQQLLRLDRESRCDLTLEETQNLLSIIRDCFAAKKLNLCILQDYNKGVLTKEVIAAILQLGKAYGVPITVDPKFNNFWDFEGVQLFKPNLKEVQNVLPFEVTPDLPSLERAATFIRQRLNNERLLVTLSDNGVFISSQNGSSSIYPTSKRMVADVCGAGDAVIAIASLAYCIGLGEPEIAMLSNLAGGQVVERVGVAPITKEQLVEEIENKLGRGFKGQSNPTLET